MINEKLELLRSLFRLREATDSFIGVLSPALPITEEDLRRRFLAFAQGERLNRGKKLIFIFTALLIYSPSCLVGQVARRGFVAMLSRVCGLNRSSISGTIRSLLFQYAHYKDFRLDVWRCVELAFAEYIGITGEKAGK